MTPPSDSPRARFLALPPERRSALLDPAEAEFVAHGFSGASLNRILAAAGMSKGQAYYYISGKADLYALVIERGLDRLLERLGAPTTSPGTAAEFWAQLARFLRDLTAILVTDPPLRALAVGLYEGARTQAALARPLARLRAAMEDLVVLGQGLGAVRADLPRSLLVDVLLAAARGLDQWFAQHVHELTADEAVRVNDRAVDMLRAMASPPDPRSHP